MPATRVTTVQQRQAMARRVEAGQVYRSVAAEVNVSRWTVRKWARRARCGGEAGLVSVWGRPITGPMADCSPLVRYVALRLKRQHPTWGAP